MSYPLPRIHQLTRHIDCGHAEIEIPTYLNIAAVRVIAPEFVLQGTCVIERQDYQLGMVHTGIMPVKVFNTITAFPIRKALAPHDRMYMKFDFPMPDVFPENEWITLFIIAE